MVARNFYQGEHNILYPQLDENGERPGYVAMEFPLLSYCIYTVSAVFGYDHWYGRLINLIIVTIGCWFFYRMLCLYFEKQNALISTIVYSCSALFHLARKVLPDPMSLSLIIIGLYFGLLFLKEGKWIHLFFYFFLATAGTLVKIPFGLYLAILAMPFYTSRLIYSKKLLFVFASAMLLIIVYWWYFVWNIHLSEISGIWYNSGRTLSTGMHELGEHFGDVLSKFYFSIYHGFILFALSLVGLCLALFRKQKTLIYLLIILTPLFGIYMLKSGFLFAHHGYYALVLMPLFVLMTTNFLLWLPKKWGYALLAIGVIEAIANQQHDFFVKEKDRGKLELESIADQLGPRYELVALVCGENPNEFYFLNRKGWMVTPDKVNISYLSDLKNRGCKYLFVKPEQNLLVLPYPKIFENHEYIVFKL